MLACSNIIHRTPQTFTSLIADQLRNRAPSISVPGVSEASVQLQQPKLPSAIRVDNEVELRCHVDGSGDMKYEWFKLVASSVLTSSIYLSVSRAKTVARRGQLMSEKPVGRAMDDARVGGWERRE